MQGLFVCPETMLRFPGPFTLPAWSSLFTPSTHPQPTPGLSHRLHFYFTEKQKVWNTPITRLLIPYIGVSSLLPQLTCSLLINHFPPSPTCILHPVSLGSDGNHSSSHLFFLLQGQLSLLCGLFPISRHAYFARPSHALLLIHSSPDFESALHSCFSSCLDSSSFLLIFAASCPLPISGPPAWNNSLLCPHYQSQNYQCHLWADTSLISISRPVFSPKLQN